MNEWISVKDRLPYYDWVLVCVAVNPRPVSIARYTGEKWDFLSSNDTWDYAACKGDCTIAMDIDEITHWMPLPKTPEIK
jgi:hypothetical protein